VSPVIAYIGLGSNLGDPLAQVRSGLQALAGLPHSRLLRSAGLYRSAPLGPSGQPDYINSVAALETELPPLELLCELQRIEDAHGRVRAERWGPRTLDLDLLLYGELQLDTPELVIPHPEIARRSFVLRPLGELLAEDAQIPGQGALKTLLARCPGPFAVRASESGMVGLA